VTNKILFILLQVKKWANLGAKNIEHIIILQSLLFLKYIGEFLYHFQLK
jgi:hypothetical protein